MREGPRHPSPEHSLLIALVEYLGRICSMVEMQQILPWSRAALGSEAQAFMGWGLAGCAQAP